MYSVVLLAALTTAPTTQAWRGHRCHGCNVSACSYACHGCSYGCHGATRYSGHGCAAWAGYGAHGYGWAGHGVGHPGVLVCHGCYGCYGGYSCYGMPTSYAPIEVAPPSIQSPFERKTERKPDPKPSNFEETPPPKEKKPMEQARARVIVDVPADAKLYVDGALMQANSSRRTFQTPDLLPGQTYFYDVRAEIVRDGQVISASQRVVLRPGEVAQASFADLDQRTDATASAGSR